MLKKLVLGLICTLLVPVWGAQTITIFGKQGNLRLSEYPVTVRNFAAPKTSQFDSRTTLAICEALDNSALVLFRTVYQGWEPLFQEEAICNSFVEFFRRGGIAWVGPQDEVSLKKWGKHTRKFFNRINELQWNMSRTKAFAAGDKGVKNKLAPEFEAWAPGAEFLTFRTFKIQKDLPWKAFTLSPQGAATSVIQDRICGKGILIYSYDLLMFRQAEHKMLIGLLKKAFGSDIRKVSLREKIQLRQKRQAHVSDQATIDLRQGGTIQLVNILPQKSLQAGTQVQAKLQQKVLHVRFDCQDAQADDFSQAQTLRDSAVCNDSCVEVFLQNMQGTEWHFAVNRRNTVFDEKNQNSRWDCSGLKTQVKNAGRRWQVDLEIPLQELGCADEAQLRANFCRENHQLKEFSSWQAAKSGFRSRQAMGILQLQEPIGAVNGENKFLLEELPLFTRLEISSLPGKNAREQLPQLRIVAAQNDKECVQIALYNQTAQTLTWRWEGEKFLKKTQVRANQIFTVQEAIPWQDSLGRVVLEPLVKLNEGNIITVPAGETRMLWLAVKADQLPAGKYQWDAKLVSTASADAAKKISVVLDLQNWRMPEDLGFPIFCYGPYEFSWARNQIEAYWNMCADYHVNWILLNEIQSAPFSKNAAGQIEVSSDLRKYLQDEADLQRVFNRKKVPVYWTYGYGLIAKFDLIMKRLGTKVTFASPEGQRIFKLWIANYAKALRQAGIDTNRIYWTLKDEPRTRDLDLLIQTAKELNRHQLQVFCNFATWSITDDIRRMLPYCAFVQPWEPRLLERRSAPEELKLLQQSGKPFATYLCAREGVTQDYLSFYRFRGLRSFQMKATGIGLWCLNAWHDNEWHTANNSHYPSMFLFHHGDNGPIATIRFEALREGAEDLYLLHRAAKSTNSAAKKLIAPELLAQLGKNNSPQEVKTWREKLTQAFNNDSSNIKKN